MSIVGEDFYINGKPTFKGREWKGYRIDGLLPNSRMVNGIFDDLNPASVHMWKYPDTQKWDAARNTAEIFKEYAHLESLWLNVFQYQFPGR